MDYNQRRVETADIMTNNRRILELELWKKKSTNYGNLIL